LRVKQGVEKGGVVDIMDEVELELRRLWDDLAAIRACLILMLGELPPPPKTPERAAA
jgi:hypothetical protein